MYVCVCKLFKMKKANLICRDYHFIYSLLFKKKKKDYADKKIISAF